MFRRDKKREKGQSLVEIAISFPILLMILSGLLDIGRVYYVYIALEDAAAEGALYLALNPTCDFDDSAPECADPNNAQYRAVNATNQIDIKPEYVDPYRSIDAIGAAVAVTISYPFQFITPGISAFADQLIIEVTATHLVILE